MVLVMMVVKVMVVSVVAVMIIKVMVVSVVVVMVVVGGRGSGDLVVILVMARLRVMVHRGEG